MLMDRTTTDIIAGYFKGQIRARNISIEARLLRVKEMVNMLSNTALNYSNVMNSADGQYILSCKIWGYCPMTFHNCGQKPKYAKIYGLHLK